VGNVVFIVRVKFLGVAVADAVMPISVPSRARVP
jgi:hypothetical protein